MSGSHDVTGPIIGWQIFKWEHLCVSIGVIGGITLRNVTMNGKDYLNSTASGVFVDALWTHGYNMTFGDREGGTWPQDFPLKGYITDVQVFSRPLSIKERKDYTLCNKVTFLFEFISLCCSFFGFRILMATLRTGNRKKSGKQMET